MKKAFIYCNLGALMLFFLPTGMLLTDAPDNLGLNWSNFLFLWFVHAIPSFIVWLNYRKVKGAFNMFLIFEALMLSYVLLNFLSLK